MFKEKSSKKRIVTSESSKDHSTLDARHQQMIQSMQDRQGQILELQRKRASIQVELDKYAARIHDWKINQDYDHDLYHETWSSNLQLQEQLQQIDESIQSLKCFEDEIDYYENTGYILFQYYDLLQKQDHGTAKPVAVPPTPPRLPKGRRKAPVVAGRNILDAFGCIDTKRVEKEATDLEKEVPKVHDKSSLVDEYLSCMDPNYLRPSSQDHIGQCTKCHVPLICFQQDGIMVCPTCGYQELLLVEQNRPILRQPSKEASHFSYKRINHFREWCSQVQGKESTDIPESIFEQILQEIKKEKIVDTKKITYAKMREILKKLKINKYYEHINYIINRINGVPTPHFPPELEDKLCNMFKEIQGPFLRHCPKDRKNFLSYSYVLSMFFRILDMPEYLKYFPLLKSREKLYAQDQIFKAICEELNWPFYPSL